MTGTDAVVLQARDRRLLEAIGRMRLIDLDQARRIGGFGSYQRTHDRMTRLTRAGFLRRLFLPTEAGGRKAIYLLTGRGAEAVGGTATPLRRRSSGLLVGDFFAFHQLAVNDMVVELEYAVAPRKALAPHWRTFPEPLSKTVLLTPDLYFEIEKGGQVRGMFLEADLGSEPKKVWKKKIELYLRLAVSGEFGRIFGREQFRVLVVTGSARRAVNLAELAAETTTKLFWFTTFSQVRESGFEAPIWLRPGGKELLPFFS